MQDRYVGDVGDFGKYGLLRALVGTDLRLGVVWYLNPAEEANADGGRIAYLHSDEAGAPFRACDADLYRRLRQLVTGGDRRVAAVAKGGVLPSRTLVYEAPLPGAALPRGGARDCEVRREHRATWGRRAVAAMTGANLVFLDPDNGLAPARVQPHRSIAAKYVFREELRPYLAVGQSLVVYQHQTRHRGGLVEHVRASLARLATLDGADRPWALTYRAQVVRTYFVIPTPAHAAILEERSRDVCAGAWGRYFRVIDLGVFGHGAAGV